MEVSKNLAACKVDLMSGIGPPHSDEQVVLRSEIEGDISLSFAAVRAADDDVDLGGTLVVEEPQMARNTDNDIVDRGDVCVDAYVRQVGELTNPGLSRIRAHLSISWGLHDFRTLAAFLVSSSARLG